MHNSLGEISHRFGKNKTETFLVRRQRSVQEIKKKHPVELISYDQTRSTDSPGANLGLEV